MPIKNIEKMKSQEKLQIERKANFAALLFSKPNTVIFAKSQQNFAAAFLQHFDYAVFCMAAATGARQTIAVCQNSQNISDDFAYHLSTLLFIYV
jgi:hypothetical protein